jgi:galactokinase/mevalonate kinase-like predicted kinase
MERSERQGNVRPRSEPASGRSNGRASVGGKAVVDESGPRAQAWLASAPGRCGIIGNPTDMYGGSVISCSTRERAYVTVEPADELILEADQGPVVIRQRADLQLKGDHVDILRAVIAHQRYFRLKARIRCWSEIPFAAGLSGSTALLVAALRAMMAFYGQQLPPHHFAECARSIELNYLGVVCGYQDHYMATFGGLNYMDFRDKEFYREVGSEPYATIEPLVPHVQHLPALPFILANTGVQHHSGAVHKPIRERWLEGDREVVDGYVRIGKLAREGKKALLSADWKLLGELMNENHDIQRRLGGSGPENERLIEAALRAGAYGAKLAGAGQGGTIIAVHPEPQSLERALQAAGARRLLYPLPSEGVRLEALAGPAPSPIAAMAERAAALRAPAG